MALTARALTIVAQVKAVLIGIGESIPAGHDATLEFFINAATDEIERYCRRIFLKQTYTQETYVGTTSARLQLRQWPVISVALVEESTDYGATWAVVPSGQYFIAPIGATENLEAKK